VGKNPRTSTAFTRIILVEGMLFDQWPVVLQEPVQMGNLKFESYTTPLAGSSTVTIVPPAVGHAMMIFPR